jgi:hypothetical protein
MHEELIAAGRAGAAGLGLVFDNPRGQVRGYFDPHNGTHYRVPGVFVGGDEGIQLRRLAARGRPVRIVVRAKPDDARTRNLIATLPGQSRERIVLGTNTDGNTWVQENGNGAGRAGALPGRPAAEVPRQDRRVRLRQRAPAPGQ